MLWGDWKEILQSKTVFNRSKGRKKDLWRKKLEAYVLYYSLNTILVVVENFWPIWLCYAFRGLSRW